MATSNRVQQFATKTLHLTNVIVRQDTLDLKRYIVDYSMNNLGSKPTFFIVSNVNKRKIVDYLLRQHGFYIHESLDTIKVEGVRLIASPDLKEDEIIIA